MTRVINLYAGPGAGKSTVAAGLFYEMKRDNHNVELVREYAKDLVWEGNQWRLSNSVYVIAEQYRRLKDLDGKVDTIITDAPLLQNLAYLSDERPYRDLYLTNLTYELYHEFDNVNIFLMRSDARGFNPEGRNHDLKQAKALDERITGFCDFDYVVEMSDDPVPTILYKLGTTVPAS